MLQTQAQLIERQVDGASQELTLRVPDMAGRLAPGQPILIRTGWGLDPYLPRIFYPVSLSGDMISVRIQPGGDRGHAWLRLAPVGMVLSCAGPVGQGFAIPDDLKRVLCLGEGDHAWALMSAITSAVREQLSVTLAIEAMTARATIPNQRIPPSVEYRLTTVDGSRGRKGRLETLWSELIPWADVLLAAGSMAFYRRLRDAIESYRVVSTSGFAQVLYPGTFLCGTGACMVCAADVGGGRRRVCIRGPVFDLTDLFR